MPSICPQCERDLAAGAFRCRHCGADAREGERAPVRVSMKLDDLFPAGSRVAVGLELLEEVERRRFTYFTRDGAVAVVTSKGDDAELTYPEVERIYRALGLNPFGPFERH